MPVDLRQISFYPLKRQYIVSDSEPGIEVVQSGDGAYFVCTNDDDEVVFQVANDGLISSAAGQAEYSTLSSSDGNPITLVAQGANQDVRFMHTANSTSNVTMFLDGATKHLSIGGAHDSTPDSRLHVFAATAGSVTAVTDTIITAENDDNAFISLLAPTSSGILFGDVADADIGRITYTHSDNALNLYVSASQQFAYTDATLQFKKATSLTTSSGALTLAPVSGAHLTVTLGGAGDFRVNTSQLYVDTSASRVGVNTATPSAGLEVVAAESATVPALMVQNSFDAVSNQVAVFRGSNRGTAADNDSSYITYEMEDSAGNMVEVGRQIWQVNDVTAGTKDSKFTWQVMVNNTLTDMLEISSSAAAVPTATFASGDAIFNDNVSIRLGTAGVEADLSSNGTDVKWEYAATADLLIGRASSPAPNGLVHIWEATAGSVDSITDSLLTLENSDNAYISILAPTVGGLVFGDAADNDVGSITYTHSSNTLNTTINAVSQLNHTDGAFAFAKATTVSTSSGTLTINAFTAGGAIDFGNQNMTNVDIDSGDMTGVTISGALTWSAAQNLNSQALTNANIDSGAIDGTTIGANSTSTIVGTTIDATTDFTIGSLVITDDQIQMTPSASDTVTISSATNGAFSIVTVDNAAAAANIQITADGTVDIDSAGVLTLDSGAAINLEPASGSAILLDGTISVDAGVVTGATSITSTAFVGTLSTAAQGNITSLGTLTALTVDDVAIDGKVITMTGSASDTAVLTAATNGAFSLVTTDTAAAAANIQITADGTVDIDSAGVLTLDSGAAINLEPASGSAILLDGTISIDGGAVTGVASIFETDIKIGEDDQTKIDFETVNTINFYVNNAKDLVLSENGLTPGTSDGTALGTTSLMWSDLFLASGSVVNFNNGDMTVTHSADTLTVAGGTLAAAAITGTTIDASTDFTIGSTVITDDVITFTPSSSDTVTLTSSTNGAFSLVTVDTAAAAANIQITADGTVDIDSAGVLTLDSGAAINLEPASGSAILLDGTISVDAGVVTGATSITSTNFVGTVTTATQNSITTMTGLVTTGALDSGSITSGFTSIDVGSGAITTTGTSTTGALTINGDITTAAARDWDLIDDDANALSFDASGKAAILNIDTTDGSERVTMSGNLLVTGDLTVSGTNTTVSSTVITVADPLIALSTTNTGNAVDIGFYGRYRTNGTNLYTGFVWDSNVSKYILFHGNQAVPDTTVNTGGTGYTASTLVLGTLESSNIAAHTLTGKLTAGAVEIEGSGFDINGGTVDAITSLTVANNVDVGNYKVTAKAFEASDLTAGRITFAGTDGLLADDSDLTFATDTLTATKIGAFEAAGAINFASQAMTSVNIDSGAIDGVTLGTNSAITNAVIDDVAINGKVITMTGDTGDTAVFTAGTAGTLSIVTTDAAAAAADIQITADGTVDIDSAGILTLDSGAAINIEPASGSAILLDGTISIDAGAVTGATSITSTNFVGTVTTATQNSITTMTGLVTTSALNSGSITSGFGAIDIGSDNLTATGTISLGATSFNDNDITNVGGIALDTITSDAGAGITLTPTTDTFFSNGTGVVIGHTAQETISIDGSTDLIPELQVLGTAAADSSIMLAAFSTTATIAGSSILAFVKGGNATIGSHTVVTDGEELGNIVAYGDDGTDLESIAAQIQFEVDGTPGTGDMPGRILLATTADGAQAATERMRVNALGQVLIGDTSIGTSVDMDTPGLVISQAAGDKHILALKSSDVAHGVTTVAETDTYGAFLKSVAASGGLSVIGLSEGEVATRFDSIYTTDDTGKAASANAAVEINAKKKDGTGVAAMGSNANILSLQNNGSSRFIFDAEGDFYADASINADYYDDYNDPVLVRDLDLAITQRFDQWTQYNRADIEKAKLVHFDEKDRPFVNWTRVWKLHNGAIWQLYEKMERLEEENKSLKESFSKMLSEG